MGPGVETLKLRSVILAHVPAVIDRSGNLGVGLKGAPLKHSCMASQRV